MKPDEIENGSAYIGHDGDRRFVDQIDNFSDDGVDISLTYMTAVESGPVRQISLEEFAAWAKSPAPREPQLGRAA